MNVGLVVTNFPAGTREAELVDHLSARGLSVLACRVYIAENGLSRALTIIENSRDAARTLALAQGIEIAGRVLRVQLAQARPKPRPSASASSTAGDGPTEKSSSPTPFKAASGTAAPST